jgi:hypothetical protein
MILLNDRRVIIVGFLGCPVDFEALFAHHYVAELGFGFYRTRNTLFLGNRIYPLLRKWIAGVVVLVVMQVKTSVFVEFEIGNIHNSRVVEAEGNIHSP